MQSYLSIQKKHLTEWNGPICSRCCGIEHFCRWVKIILVDTTAMISTNNFISHPFELFRGTKQGSPISPLLFVLAMEPLAIAVRSHTSVHGMDIEHKIAMYANDTILFLSQLAETIPAFLELINQFGTVLGFKVNREKSSVMFLNVN